ncbi:AIPR family protein [Labilibaculum filiforme]|nr:AIPR family protein [Labilibaculum filiforme]
MEIDEYFNYRSELLDRSKDDDGFVSEPLLLSEVMPSLLDAKLVDSEDVSNSYNISSVDNSKVNAYQVNESGERLQIFIIDEKSFDLTIKKKDLLISQKSDYDFQFKRSVRFINKAIKGHLNEGLQDSDPSRPLITHLSSSEGAHQFDVVEVFLISATATVSLRTASATPKRFDFEDEEIKISYNKGLEKVAKNLLIKKRLIDLNFLYNVLISEGNREALVVDFENVFGKKIETIKAADESNFESYLCVFPASIIAGLYKNYSSRLLEKNVRSFLQFRGVNQGIKDTIRKEPEKFIAYNNGLTITATEGDIIEESGRLFIKSLKDFQIVNGGQTTATIYFSEKDGLDISKVNVMAKINVAKESTIDELEELISNISTFSNAQSRVSKVDLRSRNPQLVQLKGLTESVVTPSGKKWFFERAKGEFSTMLRIAGTRKAVIQKDFPSDKRFSKEQLAKYYTAWGEKPFVVKKGGEKVFRAFIEELSGDGVKKKPLQIDRTFYEELIAKMILFRVLEKTYGQGKNSMGQIRSAVVPYTLSILYKFTDGARQTNDFDLLKIWKEERLENDLLSYLTQLLELVNNLIKKYALSDDIGEYSKKSELWDAILSSVEIKSFMNSSDSNTILLKYALSEKEKTKRLKARKGAIPVDFSFISANALIHANGVDYYRKIASLYVGELNVNEERKLSVIIASILQFKDLDKSYLDFEKQLINRIRIDRPEIFDKLPQDKFLQLYDTLDYIIKKYNLIIDNNGDLVSEFKKIETIAEAKGLKYTSVINEIGKQFYEGTEPNIKQLDYASHCLLKEEPSNKNKEININAVELSELVLRRMVEWDALSNVLSVKERNYVADFAYGLKSLTSFHERNVKKHLNKLIISGFKIN